jgi:tyrosyl-tRNA synthetase
MATNTDENKIKDLLEKNVEEVSIKSELEAALKSGEVLRIKLGIDPTGPKIHLGRAIPLRKLRDFQKMGHQVVLIVGDFTAQVGDASDKTEKRPMITRMQIDENLKDYKSQIGKILDLEKTEFVYNNDWLGKLTFKDVSELSECFTVQQMLARRNFKDRYERGVEISLREFLYPIMQGYDSVAVKADVEIGGFDQLFNLKAGRVIQDHYGMKKQNIMTGVMLDGTDGRKMSTSWGNIITIVDEPNDMFGKLMSLRDDLIVKYFRLCTDREESFILDIENKLKEGENPRDMKMLLAEDIVTLYHNEKLATLAKNNFVETFQKGGIPDDVPEVLGADGDLFSDLALKAGAVESKTEWKRLVEDGAVSFEDGTALTDYKEIAKSCILKIGKRRFLRIRL